MSKRKNRKPETNIRKILGEENFIIFSKWMNGQTTTVYKKDSLVYPVDLIRFLKRLTPLD